MLDRLPAVRHPPVDERLPFGPRNLSLYRAAWSRVAVGRGGFGYRFFDETFGVRKKVVLRWDVTTTLTRIDRRGRVVRIVDGEHQYLGVERDIGDRSFWLDAPRGPALYRYDIEFRDHRSGEVLGSYSEYFRVVRTKIRMRIATSHDTVRPGQTIFARVENPGTVWASFGVEYAVQRFEGGVWTHQPLGGGVWPAIGLYMSSGGSGWCMRYRVPAGAAPGSYRFVKQMEPQVRGAHDRRFTAGFRVVG
ncbi:MAG: immunoglobulin-like domain-containing protein [Solirubrobacterales bacterium]